SEVAIQGDNPEAVARDLFRAVGTHQEANVPSRAMQEGAEITPERPRSDDQNTHANLPSVRLSLATRNSQLAYATILAHRPTQAPRRCPGRWCTKVGFPPTAAVAGSPGLTIRWGGGF